MATAPQEMEDLSKVTGALLVNFGTISNIEGMVEAGQYKQAVPISGRCVSKTDGPI